MSRGIYLAGGGSAVDEATVWDEMLADVGSLLFWPVALSGAMLDGAEAWLLDSLSGRSMVQITTWHDLTQHRGDSLDGFDLIFVSGGNTFDLQDRLGRSGLASQLPGFLAAGGTYYGGSAGAVLAGESIGIAGSIDPDTVGSPDHSGLRLIGADLLPHFGPDWVDHAVAWSEQHPDRLVIGVPEAGGIHCDPAGPDPRARVIGPEPVQLFSVGVPTSMVAAGETFMLPGQD